ncbi:MAG: TIR domain-containing protein [Planctomycetota bacterium]|jgi:hypothetical protein
MIESRFTNVLISYAREDAEEAQRLYNALSRQSNIEPWLDSQDLVPGIRWKEELMRVIERCDVILVLLSNRAIDKQGYFQWEIRRALEKAELSPPERIVLVPVRLDDCDPPQMELKEFQMVDFFPDWDSGFRQLLRALQSVQLQKTRGVIAEIHGLLPFELSESSVDSKEEFVDRLSVARNLNGCNLMHLDISELDLSKTSFVGANMVGANVRGCDLRGCDFQFANLERVDLSGCSVPEVRLVNANVWGATFKKTTELENAIITSSNIFDVRGVSDQTRSAWLSAGCFEAQTYDEFFDHFICTVGLSSQDAVSHFEWLQHGYFRLLFNPRTPLPIEEFVESCNRLASEDIRPGDVSVTSYRLSLLSSSQPHSEFNFETLRRVIHRAINIGWDRCRRRQE